MIEEEIVIEEENQEENINIEEENQEEDIDIQDETINVTQTFDKNYLYFQNVASDLWEIKHNLDKFPSVTVIDSAGSEVIGEVEYIDSNNLKIKFAGGFSGKATLN